MPEYNQHRSRVVRFSDQDFAMEELRAQLIQAINSVRSSTQANFQANIETMPPTFATTQIQPASASGVDLDNHSNASSDYESMPSEREAEESATTIRHEEYESTVRINHENLAKSQDAVRSSEESIRNCAVLLDSMDRLLEKLNEYETTSSSLPVINEVDESVNSDNRGSSSSKAKWMALKASGGILAGLAIIFSVYKLLSYNEG